MSLAQRMKILQEKEEQWKTKGKGAANDSTQFSVAGRMAKRGILYARLHADMLALFTLSAIHYTEMISSS